MVDTNVNNLNGVPNFGHGLPEDVSTFVENAAEETVEVITNDVTSNENEETSEEDGQENVTNADGTDEEVQSVESSG